MSKNEVQPSANILDETYDFLGRFIAYPSEEAHVAHTLWIVHTHLMDEWQYTPRLAVVSAELGSGKSRVLDISALLVPDPLKTANTSVAAIFRSLKHSRSTLLLDEIDTVFDPTRKDNEDLRALINDGFDREGTVLRCDGNDHTPTKFPAYCAVAMAGIGLKTIPPTILSRSVPIRMRKRKPSETVEPYRGRIVNPEGHALRDKIAAWAADQNGKLRDAYPEMPAGIEDREADVWEPLITVAEAAGGDWPERGRKACVTLVTLVTLHRGATDDKSELLRDLRIVFGDDDKLPTTTIITRLCELPEAPWLNFRGYPITDRYLASILSEYEIGSKTIRIGEKTKKGYEKGDFLDAWERHLEPLPALLPQSVTSVTRVTETSFEIDDDSPFDPFAELKAKAA